MLSFEISISLEDQDLSHASNETEDHAIPGTSAEAVLLQLLLINVEPAPASSH